MSHTPKHMREFEARSNVSILTPHLAAFAVTAGLVGILSLSNPSRALADEVDDAGIVAGDRQDSALAIVGDDTAGITLGALIDIDGTVDSGTDVVNGDDSQDVDFNDIANDEVSILVVMNEGGDPNSEDPNSGDPNSEDPNSGDPNSGDPELEPPVVIEYTNMYRLYNPNSGEHFYTSNIYEAKNVVRLGWIWEGIGWVAPKVSSIPVYRIYNPNAGDHHYTRNEGEKNWLVSLGWKDEGIGWYSDEDESKAVLRQYNPNARSGTHNFTTDTSENTFLVSVGWRSEGIAWYASNSGNLAIDAFWLDTNSGNRIWVGSDAQMAKGLFSVGSSQYYADTKNGAIIRNGTFLTGNTVYTADGNGALSVTTGAYADMLRKIAANTNSVTNYMVAVDKKNHNIAVFIRASKSSPWVMRLNADCAIGAHTSRDNTTLAGQWTVGGKYLEQTHYGYTDWYHTNINPIATTQMEIHSILYKANSKTRIVDGRLNQDISNGCVRTTLEMAKYVYDNIPPNSRIYIYD